MDAANWKIVRGLLMALWLVGGFMHALNWGMSLSIKHERKKWAMRWGLATITPRLCALIVVTGLLCWPVLDLGFLIVWLLVNEHEDEGGSGITRW